MKTEQALHRFTQDVENPVRKEVVLEKEEAKLILARMDYLEGVAAALLKSQGVPKGFVLPYRKKGA